MPRSTVRAACLALSFTVVAAVRGQDASSSPPAPPAAPVPDEPGPPLTLEECVAQALAKNFTVRIQRYPVAQAKDSVIIAQSTYDPVFGVQWQKTVTQSPIVGNSVVDAGVGGQPLYDNNQSTTLTLAQNVPTGGSIAANYAMERDTNNNEFSLLNPAYYGTVSLNVTQPLLQGAGTDYALAAIQRAKLGARIANLNFKSTVLTTIFNVETAYFDLIFARQQYAVARDTLKLSEQLYDENVEKRKAGVLTDLDVLQAQAGVATARSQLIGFEQTAKNNEDTLLEAMGEKDFNNPVGPVTFPPLPDTSVSFDYAYKSARDNGPDLAVVEATIEQFKLDALKARRDRLPQLNVNGGGGYSSEQHSYSSAENQLWSGNGYNWNVGVQLSIPLGMRANRALYRQALANVNSEEVTLEQTDQNLMVQIRFAVRAVQSNVAGVQASNEAAALSQKQYELQKAKFDAGLATSYDVLQAEDQLEAARVSQLQADANLHAAMADLHFLEGSSLDSYHVNLGK
jgi:outer membrane protein